MLMSGSLRLIPIGEFLGTGDSSEMSDEEMSDQEMNGEPVPTKHFTPRPYQEEILECAKKENVIACLGTGTGKTYIAVMLVKAMSGDLRPPFCEGGKRTIFLVPTVPLVGQQATVMRDHTDLIVGEYFGARGVDYWSKKQWQKEFEENHILVMTAEIFRVVLQHGFLSLSQVNLIVFDECHRAVKNHPYTEIMRCFDIVSIDKRPKILGLTASILNGKCKPHKVEELLKNLEKTLMGVARVTKNLLAYNKFGTKPKEFIVHYSASDTVAQSHGGLEYAISLARTCVNDFTRTSDAKKGKKLKNMMTETYETLTTLGPWCAHDLAMQYSADVSSWLENSCDIDENEILICNRAIENLRTIAGCILSILPDSEEALLFRISSKPEKLLQILKSSSIWEGDMCSIVFVQKRITALVLYKWLDAVSKSYPEYRFIRCNFIVGHGATSVEDLKDMEMSTNKQKDIISDFHEKKYNLIIATSVIEEGLDVPLCNLVIRYDMPLDYRAYIQSKGRARAAKSLYIMMICETEKHVSSSDLMDYKVIEKILKQRCFDRQPPSLEDITNFYDDEMILPPYMPKKEDGCPRITMSSAISLINRYCTLLPSNTVTHLRPVYRIKEVYVYGHETSFFQCDLYLPMNSPVKELITGEVMSTQRKACMSAALKACELLHQKGELDENLLPKRQDDFIMSDTDDEDTDEEGLAKAGKKGTRKRAKYYPKEIADAFCGKPPSTSGVCYVYRLSMKLVDVLPNIEMNRFNDPTKTTRGFGLLSTNPIPSVRSFPLFLHSGQAEIKLDLVKSGVTVTEEQIALVKFFHKKLFEDVLKVAKNQTFDPEAAGTSYYVVPVNAFSGSGRWTWTMDLDFLMSMRESYKRMENSSQIDRPFRFQRSDYEDAVVEDRFKERYYVRNVDENLNPTSAIPNYDTKLSKVMTFEKFHLDRYQETVIDKKQSILEVRHVKNPLVIFPPYLTPKMEKQPQQTSKKLKDGVEKYLNFIPELVTLHPFPASLWFKALALPCILHRLNSLLLIEHLRVQIMHSFGVGKVTLDTKFKWLPIILSDGTTEKVEMPAQQLNFGECLVHTAPVFQFNKHPPIEMKDLVSLLDYSGPELDMLLTACTPKKTHDLIDLERLEMIGDAFLKYASSEYMYATYPMHNEGKLTACKMKQVSNAKLVKIAKDRGLTSKLVAVEFQPRVNFLIPGYVAAGKLEEAFASSGIPEKYWNIAGLPSDVTSLSKEVIATHVNKSKNDYEKSQSQDDDFFPLTDFVAYGPPLTIQYIADKTVADSVEALIGAFLVSGGRKAALFFMSWLGLKVMKDIYKEEIRDGLKRHQDICINARFKQLDNLKSPLLYDNAESKLKLDQLMSGLDTIEKKLKYSFNDKAYLLQAVTCPTCTGNRITDCYERLEFLGDAVLDYLVTRYLYNDSKHYSPGNMTDIRASLVNNSLLSEISVKYEFHKFLKYNSPELFAVLRRYLDKTNRMSMDTVDKAVQLYDDECEIEEEIQVPKALADIVEALIGAVYLDSHKNLDTVWSIIFGLMGTEIELFKEGPPKNAVRLLMEAYPLTVKLKFGEMEIIGSRKVKLQIEVEGMVFVGIGANKKLARLSACKRALQTLRR